MEPLFFISSLQGAHGAKYGFFYRVYIKLPYSNKNALKRNIGKNKKTTDKSGGLTY